MSDLEDAIKASESLEKVFASSNTTLCSKCDNKFGYNNPDEIQRGCCSNCANTNGYYYINTSAKLLHPIYWWDNVYGFFNPCTLTCNIPRLLRSSTCLGYTCNKIEMPERNIKYINKLIGQIKAVDIRVLITHLTGIEDPYLNYVESLSEVGKDITIPEYSSRNEDHPDASDVLYNIYDN